MIRRRAFIKSGLLFVPQIVRAQFVPIGGLNSLRGGSPCGSAFGASLKGFWPLNDNNTVLANGNIAALCSDAAYAFVAPNTAIISGTGIGGLTPCADFNANFVAGGGAQKIYSTDAGLQVGSNQQMTISCWFKPSVVTASSPLVCQWNAGCWYLGWSDATHFKMGIKDGSSTNQNAVSAVSVSTGNWYHVIGGWDGSNVWCQVNNETRVNTPSATFHSGSDHFTIGNYSVDASVSIPINGFITGVMYWWRSLSTADVTVLYNGGTPIADPFAQ